MSVLSGILGVVNGQDTVRTWSVTSTADLSALYASNTKGAPIRLDGNKDWTGEFTAYGFQPALVPGEFFKFQGSVDGAKGVTSEVLGAIVDTITITGDIEGGGAIEYTCAFSGNGTLTSEVTPLTDATCPQPLSAIGSYVTLEQTDDAGVEANITDVRTWSITLTRANTAYNSSTTGGQTKRLKGNFDATISLSIYEDDFDDIIQPNEEQIVRIYHEGVPVGSEGDDTFWEFQWIKFNDGGGYEIDREGAALIGYTANGGFSAFTDIVGVCTEGKIIMPDTTDLWPE
jgi:hypothetical protein